MTAKKLVICDTNVTQVVQKFIGEENTPAPIVEKVRISSMGTWGSGGFIFVFTNCLSINI